MKIALLTDSFTTGGGLNYLFQVAHGLPHHRFVVCAQGGFDQERFSALQNVVVDDTGYGPATVARHAPDILHFNHLRPLAAHAFLRPRPTHATVNTVHGIHLRRYEFLRGLGPTLSAAVRRFLEKCCLSQVDINIALTESDRAYLESKLGAPRIVVIPNGVEPRFSPVGFSALRGVPENKTTPTRFLVVARFDFQKGYDILLQAIALMQEQARGQKCSFHLVGDGPLRPSMEALARSLHLQDLVQFLGASHEVDRHLAESDCLVLPSRWEGLPFILLEAGRCGRDVICSDVPGNRDVISHGESGLLFRNEDSRSLATQLTAYLQGSGRGLGGALQQRIARDYNLGTMLARLDTVYRQVKPS